MKRIPVKKHINRHIYNSVNRNVVFPILYPMPWKNNEVTSNVKIIEINSDEDSMNSEKPNPHQLNNNWFDNNDNFEVEENCISERKSKSLINEQESSEVSDDYNQTFNSHDHKISEDISTNPGYIFTSNKTIVYDTSDDDIEVIKFGDTHDNSVLKTENNPYNLNADYDKYADERNIWIYGFNRYSWDNDEQPSVVYSATSSSTSESERNKDIRRIGTPTPNYIPKLNLPTSPLPTLTEVTEPNKQLSSDTTDSGSYYSKSFQKSMNSWLDSFNDPKDSFNKLVNKRCKLSTLTQREKRRNRLAQIKKENEHLKENKHQEHKIIIYEHFIRSCLEEISNDINNKAETNITEFKIEDIIAKQRNCIGEVKNTEISTKDSTAIITDGNVSLDRSPHPHKHEDILEELNKNIVEKIDKSNENSIANNDDVFDYDLDTLHESENKEIECIETRRAKKELPISDLLTDESIPSLHLSSENDRYNEKWLTRLLKFISCCK